MRSWSQGHRAKNEIIAASSEYSGQENKVLAYVCIWEQGLQTSRQNSLYNQHMWRDAPVTSCLVTLNSELLYKLNFSPPPFALAFNPPQSWMKSMNLSRSQLRCRKPHQQGTCVPPPGPAVIYLESPYDEPLHYRTRRTCPYICHRIGLSCPRCLIGWGCHQSYAAELGLAFGSMVRLRCDLGLISLIKSELHIVRKVELNSKTYGWVFMRAVKSST